MKITVYLDEAVNGYRLDIVSNTGDFKAYKENTETLNDAIEIIQDYLEANKLKEEEPIDA
jgi:hypothetical protein